MKIFLVSVVCAFSLFADIYGTFETQSVREASLGMNASGIVKTISAGIAKRVKKGDIILQLDNTDERFSLELNKANYEVSLTWI